MHIGAKLGCRLPGLPLQVVVMPAISLVWQVVLALQALPPPLGAEQFLVPDTQAILL